MLVKNVSRYVGENGPKNKWMLVKKYVGPTLLAKKSMLVKHFGMLVNNFGMLVKGMLVKNLCVEIYMYVGKTCWWKIFVCWKNFGMVVKLKCWWKTLMGEKFFTNMFHQHTFKFLPAPTYLSPTYWNFSPIYFFSPTYFFTNIHLFLGPFFNNIPRDVFHQHTELFTNIPSFHQHTSPTLDHPFHFLFISKWSEWW